MKLLVLAPYYPHAARPFGGLFNERSVAVLKGMCDMVEVLAPRPYSPPLLSALVPRWTVYSRIASHEIRNGVQVHRPAYLQLPRLGGAFWIDPGEFFWCRQTAKERNDQIKFDAILSFDLAGVGALAWRLGKYLGIPAAGWATGEDVRVPSTSSHGRMVIGAVERLDMVFYQSHELLIKTAELLGVRPMRMETDRHMVLPRGIPEPPLLSTESVRTRVRKAWGIDDHQVLVLSIGRILKDKGVFELLDAFSLAVAQDRRMVCVMIGSSPGFDDSVAVQKKLAQISHLKSHVRLLPACSPDKVWEYLCAADIFAFTSHKEGMPNSLLEAMAMRVPAVAFAIPPVLEIDANREVLGLVPPFDTKLLSHTLLRLAGSAQERSSMATKAYERVRVGFMAKKNMSVALERIAQIVHCRTHYGAAFVREGQLRA
jgi:teichuronic acid biosynthesis glycosyltransferase TuaC